MATNQNQQPEEIQATKSEKFVESYGKIVVYACIALIVIIALGFGVKSCNESRDAEAANSEALYQAQFDFEAGNYAAALENFNAVISEFGSTKSGNLAKAYAGLCQKQLGDLDGAIANLKDYSGNDPVIAPAILSALGDCYVELETPDYASAAKAFVKAASAAKNEQFSPLFLFKAGLVYEALGEKDKALQAYESIKKEWADSEQAYNIDKYIVRVK